MTTNYISEVVSRYFGISKADISKKTRNREILQPRQITHYFAKQKTNDSLTSIGRQIGEKDHATVLHSIKTVNNLYSTDKTYRKYVDDISRLLMDKKSRILVIKKQLLELNTELNELEPQ